MMYYEIVNAMDIDELRNYVTRLYEVQEKFGDLQYAQREMIDTLHRAVNNAQFAYDRKYSFEMSRRDLIMLEDRLREKYEDVLPKPQCYCTAETDSNG